MYITVEEFEKNTGHYLQTAKLVDVYIEDATQTTVWVLRCERTPLLAQLTTTLRGRLHKSSSPGCAVSGI